MQQKKIPRVAQSPWVISLFIVANLGILAILYGFILWRLFGS